MNTALDRGIARQMARGTAGQRRSALRSARIALLALAGATVVLLAASAMLGGADHRALAHPLRWLAELNSEAVASTLAGAAQVVAGVLGIAITAVAIVVQLAATRSGTQITGMFIREPINIIVMNLFVLTTLQCLWISVTLDHPGADAVLPNAGFAITMALVTLSLLILLPYFVFVFAFLSPLSVIEQLRERAYRAIRHLARDSAEAAQRVVAHSIDELQDIARSAIEESDRGVAIACIDAFEELVFEYQALRSALPASWFQLAHLRVHDPDLVSLAPAALAEIERTKVWLEVKVLRQYLALMIHSVPKARDAADLIAISSRRIGIASADAWPELITQCIRCFNSYLRTTIKASDMRTGVQVQDQFRLFAEGLLVQGHLDAVREFAGYLQTYGVFAHKLGQSFILEVAAHDIVQLIEATAAINSPAEVALVDDLLSLLLELDQEVKQESQEDSLMGVRRAQMQLATLFIERNEPARARRIAVDLASERPERLQRIRNQLLNEERTQYWEFTPRGVNFAYLEPARRKHLATLFDWLAVV